MTGSNKEGRLKCSFQGSCHSQVIVVEPLAGTSQIRASEKSKEQVTNRKTQVLSLITSGTGMTLFLMKIVSRISR
jgi:hypothetical protein